MTGHQALPALEAALVDLGRAIAFPATPPIAATVADQIRSGMALSGEAAGRAGRAGEALEEWLPRLRMRRGIALGLLAAILLAGVALAVGIAIGGLRIVVSNQTPPPLPSGVATSRAFGFEVSLAEARRRAGFTIKTPGLAALGAPDHVFYLPSPRGGTISLVWEDRPGYPADPRTQVGLVVTEFRADIAPEYWEKLIDSGTRVERTQVGNAAGYWVAGGTHFIYYRDANGQIVNSTIRLVGTSLIWEQGGLTLRVEGAGSLAAARSVAISLR